MPESRSHPAPKHDSPLEPLRADWRPVSPDISRRGKAPRFSAELLFMPISFLCALNFDKTEGPPTALVLWVIAYLATFRATASNEPSRTDVSLPSVGELPFALVKVSLRDRKGRTLGLDYGALVQVDEWLVFEGSRTHFALRRTDVVIRSHSKTPSTRLRIAVTNSYQTTLDCQLAQGFVQIKMVDIESQIGKATENTSTILSSASAIGDGPNHASSLYPPCTPDPEHVLKTWQRRCGLTAICLPMIVVQFLSYFNTQGAILRLAVFYVGFAGMVLGLLFELFCRPAPKQIPQSAVDEDLRRLSERS